MTLTSCSCASPLGSVDGYALQIEEVKGTKPTEKIDLSKKGLGVASATIIASCIKENSVLKELKCAADPVLAFASAPTDMPDLSPYPLCPSLGSLFNNSIGDEGASALAAILNETTITNLKCAASPRSVSLHLSVSAR